MPVGKAVLEPRDDLDAVPVRLVQDLGEGVALAVAGVGAAADDALGDGAVEQGVPFAPHAGEDHIDARLGQEGRLVPDGLARVEEGGVAVRDPHAAHLDGGLGGGSLEGERGAGGEGGQHGLGGGQLRGTTIRVTGSSGARGASSALARASSWGASTRPARSTSWWGFTSCTSGITRPPSPQEV